MRSLLSLAAIWIAIAPLQAQLNSSAAVRSVAVNGIAEAQSVPPSTYADERGPVNPFACFSAEVSGRGDSYSFGNGPEGLDVSAAVQSLAWQESVIAPNRFSFKSAVTAQSWSQLATVGGRCAAEATSAFQIDFTVTTPMPYTLSLDSTVVSVSGQGPLLQYDCVLASLQHGVMWGGSWPAIAGNETVSGVLDPGHTYSLSVFLKATANLPDPVGELQRVAVDLSFVAIPEPSAAWLLLAGLAGLMGRHWLRARS